MENNPWFAVGIIAVAGLLVIVGAITLGRWSHRRATTPRVDADALLSTLGPLDPEEATIFYIAVVSHYEKNLTLDWTGVQELVSRTRMHVRARRNLS